MKPDELKTGGKIGKALAQWRAVITIIPDDNGGLDLVASYEGDIVVLGSGFETYSDALDHMAYIINNELF